jgi:hypothetical protein
MRLGGWKWLARKRNVGNVTTVGVPVANANTVDRGEIAYESDESALSRGSEGGSAVQPTIMGQELLDLVIVELFNVDSELDHLHIVAVGLHVRCFVDLGYRVEAF